MTDRSGPLCVVADSFFDEEVKIFHRQSQTIKFSTYFERLSSQNDDKNPHRKGTRNFNPNPQHKNIPGSRWAPLKAGTH